MPLHPEDYLFIVVVFRLIDAVKFINREKSHWKVLFIRLTIILIIYAEINVTKCNIKSFQVTIQISTVIEQRLDMNDNKFSGVSHRDERLADCR